MIFDYTYNLVTLGDELNHCTHLGQPQCFVFTLCPNKCPSGVVYLLKISRLLEGSVLYNHLFKTSPTWVKVTT